MEEKENSFELVENREAIELAPSWEPQLWWFLVGAGVLVLAVVLIFHFKRKRARFDPEKAELLAYQQAMKILGNLEVTGVRESAVRVSLVLRQYLAESLGEPALFQTHEEFVGRHDALEKLPDDTKQATGRFFGELAAVKYGPEEPGRSGEVDFKARGLELLERIHAA